MKKLTTLILICAASFAANAQYGQRLYYYDRAALTYPLYEKFNDGIYSTLNLVGVTPTYSGVGRADSNGIVHARYVRMKNTGAPANNILYKMRIGATTQVSSEFESICERKPGATLQNVMAGSAFSAWGSSSVAGGSDILLMRTNNVGVPVAANMIDLSGGYEKAACVRPSVFPFNTGKTVACGFTHQSTSTKGFVMKTSTTGINLVGGWIRFISLTCTAGTETYATSVIENPVNGNVLVVGYMTDYNKGGCDNGFISKFSAAGAHLNTWVFNEAGSTNGLHFNSIKAIPTSPGNYIIGGDYIRYNTSNTNSDPLPFVMTVNLAGLLPVVSISEALDPFTTPGSVNYASGEDVTSRFNTITSAFEYFVAGKFLLNGSTSTNGYIIKLAQTGAPMAGKNYGSTGADAFHAIDAVGNGTGTYDGLAAFGEYAYSSSGFTSPVCYWVKPYFNLVTKCLQATINPTVIPITLAATSAAPAPAIAFTEIPLNWDTVNCIHTSLCNALAVAGGSNLKQAISSDDAGNIKVYPSPASDVLNVDFESLANSSIEIQVMDITGKVVMNQKSSIEEGSNSLVLNIENLTSGIYMLQIKDGEQQIHRKFVKQ